MMVTEDLFEETFKPQQNHIDNNVGFNGWMYETYGEELDYVFNIALKERRVWTIIEGDNDTLFYCPGFKYVNRIGFIVCEKEYPKGQEDIQVN